MSDPVTTSTQPAEPLPPDPYVGAVIADRYRILARLGEGGMGAVYRAEHVHMRKVVALKLLHAELGQNAEAVRRFEREARSASRLNHPSIIAVSDFGRAASGELFLVMEYVPGEALSAALERAGRFPVPRAVHVVRQILGALSHAHAMGVVHRDLKPANIMLTTNAHGGGDAVKILDFGIAKLTEGLSEGEAPLTQGAMVFGTPSYMSPEQATAQDADARADLYACGVILFELLAGRKPFVAEDLVKVMAMHVTTPPPPLAAAAPEARIPAPLEAAVMRALEKDRERRHQSAADFLAALEEAQEAGSVGQVISRLGTITRPIVGELQTRYARLPWPWRRRVPVAGAGVVVLALVVIPSLCMREGPRSPPPPPRPVEVSLVEPIKRIEEAMARGKRAEARLMLMQQLSQHPKTARVHYLLGNLELAEDRKIAALAAYTEAVRLDPGLRGDAALLLGVRALVDDARVERKVARDALDLMIQTIGAPAAKVLVGIASEDRRVDFRRAAREGCKALGCLGDVDVVGSLTLDLSQAKTCEDKREAVKSLGATGDDRAIEPLRRARGAGGPLAGLFGGGNACVRKDIDAALKELGD